MYRSMSLAKTGNGDLRKNGYFLLKQKNIDCKIKSNVGQSRVVNGWYVFEYWHFIYIYIKYKILYLCVCIIIYFRVGTGKIRSGPGNGIGLRRRKKSLSARLLIFIKNLPRSSAYTSKITESPPRSMWG